MKTAIIKTDVWKDKKVRSMHIDTRMLYLCLITNPERNTTRFFKVDEDYLCIQSGIDYRQLQVCKKQLVELGVINFHEDWVILGDECYVSPAKGKLTKQIHDKDLSNVPTEVQELKIAPEPLLNDTRATQVYKDKDNNKDINKNNDKVKTTEINELFDEWENIVGYKVKAKVESNRKAASKIIKTHGIVDAKRMLKGVAVSQEDKFAPRISNFIQLESKWDELIAWGKRTSSTNKPKVAVI